MVRGCTMKWSQASIPLVFLDSRYISQRDLFICNHESTMTVIHAELQNLTKPPEIWFHILATLMPADVQNTI